MDACMLHWNGPAVARHVTTVSVSGLLLVSPVDVTRVSPWCRTHPEKLASSPSGRRTSMPVQDAHTVNTCQQANLGLQLSCSWVVHYSAPRILLDVLERSAPMPLGCPPAVQAEPVGGCPHVQVAVAYQLYGCAALLACMSPPALQSLPHCMPTVHKRSQTVVPAQAATHRRRRPCGCFGTRAPHSRCWCCGSSAQCCSCCSRQLGGFPTGSPASNGVATV